MRLIIPPVAQRIYHILVDECGAPEASDNERQFIYHQSEEGCTEWRFFGLLGFGGKFWNTGERWYVNALGRGH
jgi:hypothetical protein